jgi:hypothetical protein
MILDDWSDLIDMAEENGGFRMIQHDSTMGSFSFTNSAGQLAILAKPVLKGSE